jgi:hypothetical protein
MDAQRSTSPLTMRAAQRVQPLEEAAEDAAAVVEADVAVRQHLAPQRLPYPLFPMPVLNLLPALQVRLRVKLVKPVKLVVEAELAAVVRLVGAELAAALRLVGAVAVAGVVPVVVLLLLPFLRSRAWRSSTCCLQPVWIRIRNSICAVPATREDALVIRSSAREQRRCCAQWSAEI